MFSLTNPLFSFNIEFFLKDHMYICYKTIGSNVFVCSKLLQLKVRFILLFYYNPIHMIPQPLYDQGKELNLISKKYMYYYVIILKFVTF